ncbi:hypothetical protein [Mycobacterium asiaticum]|nr:hypothetical protein [Mycobacterium asiaticum]
MGEADGTDTDRPRRRKRVLVIAGVLRVELIVVAVGVWVPMMG